MDLDLVSRKSLDELGTNYIGDQDNLMLSSSFMRINRHGFGHDVFNKILVWVTKA